MMDNSDTTTVSESFINSAPLKGEVGELIPRPNGRGALRRGNPGNKGGTGRPPNVVRSRSRALYESVLEKLEEQVTQALSTEQLVSVGSMAGRYAGLTEEEMSGTVRIIVVRGDPELPEHNEQPRITATAQIDAAQHVTDTTGYTHTTDSE